MTDLDTLETLAKQAAAWIDAGGPNNADGPETRADIAFIKACSPETILELVATARDYERLRDQVEHQEGGIGDAEIRALIKERDTLRAQAKKGK